MQRGCWQRDLVGSEAVVLVGCDCDCGIGVGWGAGALALDAVYLRVLFSRLRMHCWSWIGLFRRERFSLSHS